MQEQSILNPVLAVEPRRSKVVRVFLLVLIFFIVLATLFASIKTHTVTSSQKYCINLPLSWGHITREIPLGDGFKSITTQTTLTADIYYNSLIVSHDAVNSIASSTNFNYTDLPQGTLLIISMPFYLADDSYSSQLAQVQSASTTDFSKQMPINTPSALGLLEKLNTSDKSSSFYTGNIIINKSNSLFVYYPDQPALFRNQVRNSLLTLQ